MAYYVKVPTGKGKNGLRVLKGCFIYEYHTTELIFRDFSDPPGITIGSRLMRYADETALIAGTNQNFQHLMGASEDIGWSMNVKKTKTMVISRVESQRPDILVNNEMLEQINSFTYLSQAITPDARNDTEKKE